MKDSREKQRKQTTSLRNEGWPQVQKLKEQEELQNPEPKPKWTFGDSDSYEPINKKDDPTK